MTPKKPTLTASRKAWLASLKPGDPVLIWRSDTGWSKAICLDQRGYLNSLRRDKVILVRAMNVSSHMARSAIASKSGLTMLDGRLDIVIFQADNREALAALWADEQRHVLRKVEWREVDDRSPRRSLLTWSAPTPTATTVQRIADMLRLDAGKEPRP